MICIFSWFLSWFLSFSLTHFITSSISSFGASYTYTFLVRHLENWLVRTKMTLKVNTALTTIKGQLDSRRFKYVPDLVNDKRWMEEEHLNFFLSYNNCGWGSPAHSPFFSDFAFILTPERIGRKTRWDIIVVCVDRLFLNNSMIREGVVFSCRNLRARPNCKVA